MSIQRLSSRKLSWSKVLDWKSAFYVYACCLNMVGLLGSRVEVVQDGMNNVGVFPNHWASYEVNPLEVVGTFGVYTDVRVSLTFVKLREKNGKKRWSCHQQVAGGIGGGGRSCAWPGGPRNGFRLRPQKVCRCWCLQELRAVRGAGPSGSGGG